MAFSHHGDYDNFKVKQKNKSAILPRRTAVAMDNPWAQNKRNLWYIVSHANSLHNGTAKSATASIV